MLDLPDTHLADNNITRSTPHAPNIEQSVLGGFIVASNQNTEILDDVVAILRAQDFYTKQHQIIYRILQRDFEKQGSLDVLTLQRALADDPEASQIPHIGDYVQTLFEYTAGTVTLLAHAQKVRDLSVRRSLMSVAEQISVRAQQPGDMDSEELVNEAERNVLGVTDNRSGNKDMTPADQLVTEMLDRLDYLYKNQGKQIGVRTGFPWLDDMTSGLQAGDLVVLAARPGIGKTSLAINIIEHALTHADNEQAPIVLFSMEMSGIQIIQRLISSMASVNLQNMRNGKLSNMDWDGLQRTAKNFKDMKHLYVDSSAILDVVKIRHRVRRVRNAHGYSPAFVVIDYLQLMSATLASGARDDNRNQEISRITRSLKGIAKEFECPVLLLSQLSRQVQHAKRKPALADLRDSGAIEQDADLVLFLHEKDEEVTSARDQKQIELILAKHRNGGTGLCTLNFLGTKTRFTEARAEDDISHSMSQAPMRRSDAMEDI